MNNAEPAAKRAVRRPEAVSSILTELHQCAAALVASPELAALLSSLDRLPNLVADLRRSLDPDFLDTASDKTKASIRQTLAHVQRALIYTEARLHHERMSLQSQLHDLDAQRDWAMASRQII